MASKVERISRLNDPDIIAAANILRKKVGLKPVKNLSKTKEEASLRHEVNRLAIENRKLKLQLSVLDREVEAEIGRAKIFFNHLEQFKSQSLRIAVTILCYWDNWGFIPAVVFARLMDRSEEFRRIYETVSDSNNLSHIKYWVNRKELKNALKFFGYGTKGSVYRSSLKKEIGE